MKNLTSATEEAKKLTEYCYNLIGIKYNSNGEVMKRKDVMPMVRTIARSHIRFSINHGGTPPHMIEYWNTVMSEVENMI